MIRVEKLKIKEFRGIRELTLNPQGKSFAICGPNGTGKSGVVDAVEFAMTGEISRLSGRGTGGLSVKAHGPHVDSRNKPSLAVVEAIVSLPALGKSATITRSVKDAGSPTLAPKEAAIEAALADAALHPEFVLSRRELIRYVLSEPGKRSDEVQALLRLDELTTIRATLLRISNSAEKEAKASKQAKERTAEDLRKALAIPKLSIQDLLAAVNAKRKVLDLAPLEKLEATTSIRDGLATAATTAVSASRIAKAQAKTDIGVAKVALAALNDRASISAATEAEAVLKDLAEDQNFTRAAERENLLQSAMALFDDVRCPVCDTEWNPEEFRNQVAEKRAQIADAVGRKKAAQEQLVPISSKLEICASALTTIARLGPLLAQPVNVSTITDKVKALNVDVQRLKKFLPLSETLEALVRAKDAVDEKELLDAIETAVAAIPDPSERDAARDYLTIGQEKLEAHRLAGSAEVVALERAKAAKTAYDVFGVAMTAELEAIYKAVEQRFVMLYRIVNRDDESAFDARLTPSFGKLGFDVDFYGRGFFPPGAYHSEGHQDGMGVCLYLALMDHLLGKNFTFAVLDDVLMSVDAGHRREVCRMMKQEFPHTQFVLTTHDEIWLRHMKSEGLIAPNACANFRKWDVEHGPAEWDERDVWQELDGHLAKNDVRSAAALLRHYLEHLGQEMCHQLRARVEFRGDAQFTLNDTLPNALKALSDAYRLGRNAAETWKQKTNEAAIQAREVTFSAAKAATRIDEWQINAAVHFNTWATLAKNDFEPVVNSFRKLHSHIRCDSCDSYLYISPDRGEKEALRCNCGAVNINLQRKPAAPANDAQPRLTG